MSMSRKYAARPYFDAGQDRTTVAAINETDRQNILRAGWVFGNPDGFIGERIYPSWQGALAGKRLVMRDVRTWEHGFFVHDPCKDSVDKIFPNLAAVEAYILENGKVITDGGNVWD